MADNINYNHYLSEDYYDDFSKMCEKAQTMIFNYLLDGDVDFFHIENDWLPYYLSPIEQIFYVAYKIVIHKVDFSGKCMNGHPLFLIFREELYSQSEIQYKDKNYTVDFEFDLVKRKNLYGLTNDLKYVIELDGYEYHSSKKQMEYDYERENNLKELGYKVIRFTGSQVYKNPFQCVVKFMNIILNDMKKNKKYGQ